MLVRSGVKLTLFQMEIALGQIDSEHWLKARVANSLLKRSRGC
jgi:hypothetical protein